MPCFCDKLRTEKYSDITPSEAEVLIRASKKAPHLFSHPQGPFRAASNNTTKSNLRHRRSRCKPSKALSKSNTLQVKQLGYIIEDVSRGDSSDAIQPPAAHPSVLATEDIATEQDTTSVGGLEKTYPCQNFEQIFNENGGQLSIQRAGQFDVSVSIFLAIERSDQIIEIKQLSKRIHCYALAKLHPKGTSVDGIVQQIQHAVGNIQNIRTKVYHFLRLGSKWGAIIDLFESVVKDLRLPKTDFPLSGILCLLGTGSAWERSSLEACQAALSNLCARTEIYEQVKRYSPSVNEMLHRITGARQFVEIRNPYTLVSKPELLAVECVADSSNIAMMAVSTSGGSSPAPGAAPLWKAKATASDALSGRIHSEDGKLLLTLLCFLASSKVPLDLLVRGAIPRKRWNEHGEVEELSASYVHLTADLECFLSDIVRLGDAFYELQELSAVSRNSDSSYNLDQTIRDHVLHRLPSEFHSFWRLQTLIISYRSVPWKYLDPTIPNATQILVPHIRHTLQAVRHHDGFRSLPTSTRIDLALTLVEASRFSNMEWKRFAITQAKEAAHDPEDPYIHSCIAQRECLLSRLAGDKDQAAGALEDVALGQGQLPSTNQRMHAAIGQKVIQRALNHFQYEELSTATEALNGWRPLHETPATIEEVVLFRMNILLGKMFRFQGKFRQSLAYLETSRRTADQRKDLFFDEDLCDLTCEHADTLRELDEPTSAERFLRTEIARQFEGRFPARLLKLSLAESLFAQKRYAEAEALCLEVKSQPTLSKMEALRLSITLAKLRHVDSDWAAAFNWWTEALVAINKFPPTSGHATRIIFLSVCDILRRQGQYELEVASRRHLTALEKLSGQAEAKYWIAGLWHWLNYLESTGSSQSNHL